MLSIEIASSRFRPSLALASAGLICGLIVMSTFHGARAYSQETSPSLACEKGETQTDLLGLARLIERRAERLAEADRSFSVFLTRRSNLAAEVAAGNYSGLKPVSELADAFFETVNIQDEGLERVFSPPTKTSVRSILERRRFSNPPQQYNAVKNRLSSIRADGVNGNLKEADYQIQLLIQAAEQARSWAGGTEAFHVPQLRQMARDLRMLALETESQSCEGEDVAAKETRPPGGEETETGDLRAKLSSLRRMAKERGERASDHLRPETDTPDLAAAAENAKNEFGKASSAANQKLGNEVAADIVARASGSAPPLGGIGNSSSPMGGIGSSSPGGGLDPCNQTAANVTASYASRFQNAPNNCTRADLEIQLAQSLRRVRATCTGPAPDLDNTISALERHAQEIRRAQCIGY